MAKRIILYEEELQELIKEVEKMKSSTGDLYAQKYYDGQIRAYQHLLWQTEDNE